MGFLKNAIQNGISKGISNAVGEAVKKVVEPKATAYANKVADEIDGATKNLSEQSKEAEEAVKEAGGLEEAFSNLQGSMERYAAIAAGNMKICPKCETPSTADKTFCPVCGAKLPELTLGQGAVCTKCGKQNVIGTKFCAGCGEKLPFAIETERQNAEKNALVISKWTEKHSQYPVWALGGTDYEIDEGDEYFRFTVSYETESEGTKAVEAYRDVLKANGFREAGEYPSPSHLYKMVDGKCFHVDTEHCFESEMTRPDIGFDLGEPVGGFNYVKPEPQKVFSFKSLFK